MATGRSVKKSCYRCNKGGATFTCDGCHQSFCLKHTADHRQELAQQMDDIGQQHDILKRDITELSVDTTLLARIDRWEKESIEKIRSTAKKARCDLERSTEDSKTRLNILMKQLSNELRSNQENDEYTEEDLERWTCQLKELRKGLENRPAIDIVEDRSLSFCLIKLRNRTVNENDSIDLSKKEVISLAEKFSKIAGPVVLSNDNWCATCTSDSKFGRTAYSSVYGRLQYSCDIHHLRFRLNTSCESGIFFGIMTSSGAVTNNSSELKSVYGYWSDGRPVTTGSSVSFYEKIANQLHDEIVLILDCPSRTIAYIHERTQQRREMEVDQRECPFPWKMLVTLWYPTDKIEILQY